MRTLILWTRACLFLFAWLCALSWAYAADNQKQFSTVTPFVFIENKGQLIDQHHAVRKDVQFALRTPGMNVFVGNGQLHYQWIAVTEKQTSVYRLDVILQGANTGIVPVAQDKYSVPGGQDYHENYYLPQCPDGITVYSYKKIRYNNIYPNIDWVLYTNADGSLKYDFIVHPGGNPANIKLKYEGASSLTLNNGSLTAETPLGNVIEQAPYSYFANSKLAIPSQFKLDGDVLRIDIEPIINDKEDIVIDPTVVWGTYHGGLYAENSNCITFFNGSNAPTTLAIIAGKTNSHETHLVSGSAHQYAHTGPYGPGNMDGFVTAYVSSGLRQWSTFYGGLNEDVFNAIECDKFGNIYAAGSTNSDTGIATPGSHQPSLGGPITSIYSDGFLVKFDITGKRLWSTYFGGTEIDQVLGLAVDTSNNVLIAGYTQSTSGIATPGTHQPTLRVVAPTDAFIAKFNPAGMRQWGTYYGGIHNDYGTAIAVDKYNNIYLAGDTNNDTCADSTQMYAFNRTAIATPGSHQPYPAIAVFGCPIPPPPPPGVPSITPDAFLVKFDASGVRQWGTYYGGLGEDYINKIVCDPRSFVDSSGQFTDGLVYIAGTTRSQNNMASFGGYQSTPDNAFIAAFKPNGKRYWGTYMQSRVNGLAINPFNGVLMAVGYNGSMSMFHGAGRMGTYVHGTGGTMCNAVTNDIYGNYYITGTTFSSIDIAYPNSIGYVSQPLYNGSTSGSATGPDAFIAKYEDYSIIDFTTSPSSSCIGDNFNVGYNITNVTLQSGNRIVIQMSDSSGSFANPVIVGSLATTASFGNVSCVALPGTYEGNYRFRALSTKPVMIAHEFGPVSLFNKPKPLAVANGPLCPGDTIILQGTDSITSPGIIHSWSKFHKDSILGYGMGWSIDNVSTTHSGKYIFTADRLCIVRDTVDIVVNRIPKIISVANNSPVCEGDSLKITVNDTLSPVIYSWVGPSGFTSADQNPVIPAGLSANGKYFLTYSRYGCINNDSTVLKIDTLPAVPVASHNTPLCFGDTIKLSATDATPGITYVWSGPDNFVSYSQDPVLKEYPASAAGTYTVKAVLKNCTSAMDSIDVVIKPLPPVPVINTNTPAKAGSELRLNVKSIPGATYAWTGPNGFTSSEQNPVIKNVPFSASGTYIVTATVDGCIASSVAIVIVNMPSETYFILYPNPNNGEFTIKALLRNDQLLPLDFLNAAGQLVYHTELRVDKKLLIETVKLPGALANGTYYLKTRADGDTKIIPFTVYK